jgi:hypothetical protein
MVPRRRQDGSDPAIVLPQDMARLAQACPDLANWPRAWRGIDADIAIGEQIVSAFTPFLLWLLQKELAEKTFRRHRDNLWLVGGEIIRRRYDDEQLARASVADALDQLIEKDGGPLIWPRITEAEQRSVDATCSKLYCFIHGRKT